MGNVTQLQYDGSIARHVVVATERMEDDIQAAISKAREAGAPQGLIVSLLHAFAAVETQAMIE